MEIYFWLYLIGAALLIVAVPTVLLFLWRISAQVQELIELRRAEMGERVSERG